MAQSKPDYGKVVVSGTQGLFVLSVLALLTLLWVAVMDNWAATEGGHLFRPLDFLPLVFPFPVYSITMFTAFLLVTRTHQPENTVELHLVAGATALSFPLILFSQGVSVEPVQALGYIGFSLVPALLNLYLCRLAWQLRASQTGNTGDLAVYSGIFFGVIFLLCLISFLIRPANPIYVG